MTRLALAAFTVVLAGCESPEATRARGGERGADTGNRPSVVRMHEGSRVYENTPHVAPTQPSPADSANHPHARGRS
jgi:hypothetical protein